MSTTKLFTFSRVMVSVALVFLAYSVISVFSVPFVGAAGEANRTAFKDPYNGGAPLPEGGGDPGKAYTAYVTTVNKAADKRDYSQFCKLMPYAPPEKCLNEKDARDFLIQLFCKLPDLPPEKCLSEKDALDFILELFTFGVPKTHKILGGFMKGDDTTLSVDFTWSYMPESTGNVVMKRVNGRWFISSIGGSASMEIDVQASGTATFNSSSRNEENHFGPIHVAANRNQYTGNKCPIDIIYTASINFKLPLPKDFSFTYHWERSDGVKTKEQSVTPTGKDRAMSVREIWHVGEAGQQYAASMKLFIDSGNTHITKDSPTVKVICK